MKAEFFLETERLYLRKVSVDDAPFYVKLFNSEGWLKYIGDRNVHTVDDAVAYIQKNYLPSYENHGYGSFAVIKKDTGEMIGACGLYKRDNLEHPDIGFSYLPEFMGQGFAYEAAKEVMRYAREELHFKKILGFTVRYNDRSKRLLRKLGLKESGTYQFQDDPEELLLFTN